MQNARLRTLVASRPKLSQALVQTLTTVSFGEPDTDPDPSTAGPDELSGDVERIYRVLRRLHSSPTQLSAALSAAVPLPLPPHFLDRVLRRCGGAGDLGFRFFSWAHRQPGFSPSPAAAKSLVRLLSRSRHFSAAWAVVDDLRRHSPSLLTPDLFVALIRRFASSRMVSKAIEVLDEMPSYGLEPDAYIFNSLLDALCKNGAVKDAALLFRDMRERFPPNLRHFTSLLYGWCREGKLEEAKFVLVQMKDSGFEPDVVVYNTLLAGFSAAGKMEDSYQLLHEMRKKGVEPNVISYTTLIQALTSKDRMDEAMRVFVEMRRFGCAPDSVTYDTLIAGFCKSGNVERARELFDSMVRRGFRTNSSTYFPFFASYEKKEELEECLNLIQEMSRDSRPPDLNIYNVVIRLACKLGDTEKAVDLWNEMEASGLSPDLDTFVTIVHGFIDHGLLVEGCGYFKEMVGRGLMPKPQYGTLKSLLNSLLRAEKLELAKETWGCMVSKGCELNVSSWTIWIHSLFGNGHVKEACYYCLDMLDAGVMPQPDTFARLMKGLKRLYNRRIAAEITEKVRAMAAERNMTFKMYKRRGVRDLEEKKEKRMNPKKGKGRRPRIRAVRDPVNGPGSLR